MHGERFAFSETFGGSGVCFCDVTRHSHTYFVLNVLVFYDTVKYKVNTKRQTMIHIGSVHEFLARRKGAKNFLLHFYATIFQKISISEKYNLEKNMNCAPDYMPTKN